MKPDWKDAPEWANWLAMDESGMWFWYAMQPVFRNDRGWWKCAKGDRAAGFATDEPDESGIDWDHAFDTLERRP